MTRPDCPNWPGHKCPYHALGCGKACVDSWDGENSYERVGDEWVWSGNEETDE